VGDAPFAHARPRAEFRLTPPAPLGYLSWLEVVASIRCVLSQRVRENALRSGRGRASVTEKEPNKVNAWRQIGVLSAIPFILALAPIVGYFLGKYLDQKFRTEPWLTFVMLGLGFVAGVRETIKLVQLAQRED